jgi:hypothetical protein
MFALRFQLATDFRRFASLHQRSSRFFEQRNVVRNTPARQATNPTGQHETCRKFRRALSERSLGDSDLRWHLPLQAMHDEFFEKAA